MCLPLIIRVTGVKAIHNILVQFIEIVRARGGSVIEPEAYEAVLREPLEKLQGEDRNANPVSGIDFWRAGHFPDHAWHRFVLSGLALDAFRPTG
jgi:hypothetical protein